MTENGDELDPAVKAFLRRLESEDLKRLEYFLRMSEDDFDSFKQWHYWQRALTTMSRFFRILILGMFAAVVTVVAFIDNIKKAVGWFQGAR